MGALDPQWELRQAWDTCDSGLRISSGDFRQVLAKPRKSTTPGEDNVSYAMWEKSGPRVHQQLEVIVQNVLG
eukprot:10938883-Prorocentrum_lima.AAC.1